MRLFDLSLLADENIHPEVVEALRRGGSDVATAEESFGFGVPDERILDAATEAGRVVLTHDADFGRLWLRSRRAAVVHLRPGHIDPLVVLGALEAANREPLPFPPPFLMTVDRRGRRVRVRIQAG